MPLPSLQFFLRHSLFPFLKTNELSPHVNFSMLPNRAVEMGTFIYLSGHVSTCSKREKKKKTPVHRRRLANHTL